jgi:hypothetical protein
VSLSNGKAAREAWREAHSARTSQRRATAPTPQMGLFQQTVRSRYEITGSPSYFVTAPYAVSRILPGNVIL